MKFQVDWKNKIEIFAKKYVYILLNEKLKSILIKLTKYSTK